MIQTILLIIMFIIGIYFGSFFTLATYRIPKGEDITHKHSYCPNCNHKLGMLDLVPIFSYIFLGGKCRYCKKPIKMRYLLFELFTGIVFVLFTMALKIDIYNIEIDKIIYLTLTILYFTSLFIIAGIDKEKNIINKSVLVYGIFVSLCYMIYSYTLNKNNVYAYVIYLIMMIVLIIIDTICMKKKLKYDYTIQLLILTLYMLIFSGEQITSITIALTILAIGIKNIITYVKDKKSNIKINKKPKNPIAFFMCVSNMIAIIISNYIIYYTIL